MQSKVLSSTSASGTGSLTWPFVWAEGAGPTVVDDRGLPMYSAAYWGVSFPCTRQLTAHLQLSVSPLYDFVGLADSVHDGQFWVHDHSMSCDGVLGLYQGQEQATTCFSKGI